MTKEEILPNNIKRGDFWNKPKTPLMLQFEEETGRNAIWWGKITGSFEYWLFWKNLKISNFTEKRKFTVGRRKKISERKKDENIRYGMIHDRAHEADPKPENGICEYCHKVRNENGKNKLVHSNKDHSYNLPIVPDEWQWVHRSCHVKYDVKHGLR